MNKTNESKRHLIACMSAVILLVFGCVLLFSACETTNPANGEEDVIVTPSEITLSGATHTPAAETVSVNAEASWTLSSNQSWLRLTLHANGSAASASLSGNGKQTVYLVADANASTTAAREAAISLKGDVKVTVKQQASNPVTGSGNPWTGVNFVKEDVAALKLRKVYFGHKSVGGNIVAGIKRISDINMRTAYNQPENNDQSLRTNIAQLASGPAFVEHDIGSDGQPFNKIASFRRFMNEIIRDNVEIAFFKFCYMDIDNNTSVNALIAAYKEAMDELHTRFPNVIIAHFTVPLYSRQASFHNSVREQFNKWLRETYKDKVFDIAVIQSVASNGTTALSWDNATIAMADEWTNDGGHLNEAGQNRIGGALIAFLAQVKK